MRTKEKKKAYSKAYREAHKEELKTKQKAYNEAHKKDISTKGRTYYESNKEKIKARSKARYEANKEKIKEKSKTYYETHEDEIKDYHKAYNEAHREERKVYYTKTPKGRAMNLVCNYRYQDKLHNRGECTLTVDWMIENIFNSECTYCHESDWHNLGCDRIDNSLPHTPENCVCCCNKCNSERGKWHSFEEFRNYKKDKNGCLF